MPRGPAQTLKPVDTGRDVYTEAIDRALRIYDLFEHVAVMFSGGKDSTATLHVMLDAARAHRPDRLPLRVIFLDEEAIPLQTVDYVRRVAAWPDVELEWYCLPMQASNACSRKDPYWYPWAPEAEDLWVREAPPEGIFELEHFPTWPAEARPAHHSCNGLFFPPERHGRSAVCMGIRAQESITRLRAVTRKADENYLVPYTDLDAPLGSRLNPGNLTKAYPVFDWTTEDVWTAPAKFGWDYNRAYDAMEMAGVGRSNQRCSPAYGNEPLQKLWTYSVCFPEIWDRMITRVPGAAAAARYALTELYSYRGRPDKPADMRWGEFLNFYIAQHTPEAQAQIRHKLKRSIRHHTALTDGDPIAVEAPHPETGVSWDWLLMIAMRGDPKDRKQAGGRVDGNPDPRIIERYRREIKSYEQRDALDELEP